MNRLFRLFPLCVAAPACVAPAYAGTFSLSLAETELVADQSATNANNRFGAAGDSGKLVGSVNSGRDEFILVSADLSSIPDTDTVTGATLTWGTDGADANSVFTANPINLFELVNDPDTVAGFNYRYQSFGVDGSSASGDRTDNVHWDLAGMGEIAIGDQLASAFLGTQLSSIAAAMGSTGGTTYDVTSAAADQTYEFVSTNAFVSAIQDNLADDQVWLVFGIDALDDGADDGLRSFLRFAEDSTVLNITTIPEPTTTLLVLAGAAVGVARRR